MHSDKHIDINEASMILIVGKDAQITDLISENIRWYEHWIIHIANSPADACAHTSTYYYDLILYDMVIRGMSPTTFIEYLDRSLYNTETPVIFLVTAENAKMEETLTSPARSIDFIPRKLKTNELASRLKPYLKLIDSNIKYKVALQKERESLIRIETELKVSKENFKNIVGKSIAGILIVDKDDILQFMNRRSEEIFQRRKQDMIGKPFGIVRSFKNKGEIEILRSNGEIGIGELTATRTEWKGREATLVLINDITQHKNMQESLRNAMIKAQESDRLKTAFLTNMSHEIRTPLNGIIGFAQLLYQQNLSIPELKKYANVIVKNGDYMLHIINDILDIALIESGQVKIVSNPFGINQVLTELELLFQNSDKVRQKSLSIELLIPGQKEIILQNDGHRFRQIMINLLNNATKFTTRGRIQFGYEEVRKNEIQFFVKDTGIGITSEFANSVFRKFEKTETIENKLNEGLGLGLSISKAMVNLMGGKIWFRSESGKGAEFYFTLPVTQADADKQEEPGNKSVGHNNSLNQKKILIVEDEEINFELIKSMFKNSNVEILWAKDGREALTIVADNDIDLILMDMKLPLMDGFEATRRIRELKPGLPIIAQTAYVMSNDKQKCLDAGCNDYLPKPIQYKELMKKLGYYLN
jgi:signal transduction histidine kinase